MAAGRHKRSIVWKPQPKQAAFMRRCEDEALYGGAADSGKSDALVIEALRQVDVPHYRGLIVRKTYPQLSELIDKTMQLLQAGLPEGAVQRVQPRVDLPQRGEDLFWIYVPHAGQVQLPRQSL